MELCQNCEGKKEFKYKNAETETGEEFTKNCCLCKGLGISIEEIIKIISPFAKMDREGVDLSEVACQRGHSSDLTIIDSGNFREAKELHDLLKEINFT